MLAGLGTAASGLAGCTEVLGSGCGDEAHDVGMTPTAFEPVELTVAVDDTVRWLNTSDRAHTVTAYDDSQPEGAAFFASGGYDSTDEAFDAWAHQGGAIYSCEAFEHTFRTPGVHHYVCVPHERAGMVGRIVVEE